MASDPDASVKTAHNYRSLPRSGLRSAEGLLSGPKPEARDLAIELLLSAGSSHPHEAHNTAVEPTNFGLRWIKNGERIFRWTLRPLWRLRLGYYRHCSIISGIAFSRAGQGETGQTWAIAAYAVSLAP